VRKKDYKCCVQRVTIQKLKQKRMDYLPFEVTEYNESKQDNTVVLNSDQGRLYVRVGKLDISIKQSDDGLGVIIDCTDAELCEQELGTMTVWFDDIEELPPNEDGSHPLTPSV
jgi:hypothetical protein